MVGFLDVISNYCFRYGSVQKKNVASLGTSQSRHTKSRCSVERQSHHYRIPSHLLIQTTARTFRFFRLAGRPAPRSWTFRCPHPTLCFRALPHRSRISPRSSRTLRLNPRPRGRRTRRRNRLRSIIISTCGNRATNRNWMAKQRVRRMCYLPYCWRGKKVFEPEELWQACQWDFWRVCCGTKKVSDQTS